LPAAVEAEADRKTLVGRIRQRAADLRITLLDSTAASAFGGSIFESSQGLRKPAVASVAPSDRRARGRVEIKQGNSKIRGTLAYFVQQAFFRSASASTAAGKRQVTAFGSDG